MSKIDAQHASASPQRLPWDESGPAQVRGLRRAITAREDGAPVPSEVAPMMADLLARIDSFADPPPRPSLQAPTPPDPANPPGPREVMRALSSARGQLAEIVQVVEDPSQRQRLLGLLHALEEHLELKREVIVRASSSGRG